MTVKDSIETAGLRTTAGSPDSERRVASRVAAVSPRATEGAWAATATGDSG